MDMQKTGKLISDRRKELGFTQQELGEKLHVTVSAVSKWERGLSFPDITLLEDMSQALGLTVEEIIDGEKKASEQKEDNIQTQKVLDIATSQVKGNKKRTKKIVTILLVVLAVIVIAFAGVVGYFATVEYDSTSWQDEIRVTAYNGSELVIPLRARVGVGQAYYGDGKIIAKENKQGNAYEVVKFLRSKSLVDIEIIDSNFFSTYSIERSLTDGNKEYFAIFYNSEKRWVYFVSQEIRLNREDRDDIQEDYIFFPLTIINDPMLYGIDLGLEYRLPNYYLSPYENPINEILDEFEAFYDRLADYSYTRSGADITITDETNNLSITVHFYQVSNHLLYKIVKA